jgi:DNA-binding NarL/FixJ family response regulator
VQKEITVLLVDDHALVRTGFRRVIEDEPGITIVGEAANGVQAIQLTAKLNPKVVLMDCSLPELSGIAAAEYIAKTHPETAVLMCSMHSEESWFRRALNAGARGYISKSSSDLDLASAIKRVASGETVFTQLPASGASVNPRKRSGLSARELQVLQLVVKGKSTKDIAAELQLSPHTVGVHRARIMKTLKIHRTAELVAYALRNGLVSLP